VDFQLVTQIDPDNPVAGDIRLSSGRMVVHMDADPQAVVQRLLVALRWFLGEHFRDQRLGVPWFQVVMARGTSDATIRSIIRRTVAHDPAIVAVDSVEIRRERAARRLLVSFAARTVDGEVVTVRQHDLFADLLGAA
jgi:hypothetical protein